MKASYLLLALLLVGCGKREYSIDAEILPFIDRWESIYGLPVEISVNFGPMTSKTVIGVCSGSGVTIDRPYWDKSTDLGKEQLLFHELGHCVMGLGHDSLMTKLNGFNAYRSIMFPYAFGNSKMYSENLDYYHEELRYSQANEYGTTCELEEE